MCSVLREVCERIIITMVVATCWYCNAADDDAFIFDSIHTYIYYNNDELDVECLSVCLCLVQRNNYVVERRK